MLRISTNNSLHLGLCLTKCYHMGPIQSLKASVSIQCHCMKKNDQYINQIFSPRTGLEQHEGQPFP